jgi:NAD(P)H-dependent flavin oxidoreductase YrpB (nitropropane dioxygenase family)
MAKNPLRTRLCEMFDIEYPIILAGMGGVSGPISGPELVAAVSNAGGLGVLGCVFMAPDEMDEMIRKTKSLTDRPFGVDTVLPAEVPEKGTTADFKANLVNMGKKQNELVQKLVKDLGLDKPQPAHTGAAPESPISAQSDNKAWSGDLFNQQIEVILEHRVPVYAAGLGDPGPYVDRLHAQGTKVIGVVGHVRAARRVARAGVDLIVAQGHEAGGHNSRIATMALVPQAVDAVSPVPVIAAGGIGDGRGLVAALALGAIGVWCGTVFIVTRESIFEGYLKQNVFDGTEDDTVVTRIYSGKPMRVIRNTLTDAWEESGVPTLPMPMQPISLLPMMDPAFRDSRADIVPTPAGQIIGMIKESKSAKQVIEEMVEGAGKVLARLSDLGITSESQRGTEALSG